MKKRIFDVEHIISNRACQETSNLCKESGALQKQLKPLFLEVKASAITNKSDKQYLMGKLNININGIPNQKALFDCYKQNTEKLYELNNQLKAVK